MGLFFYKGNENILETKKKNRDSKDNEKEGEFDIEKIQETFLKVLDNKNLSFLLGSGCSSYMTKIASIENEKLVIDRSVESNSIDAEVKNGSKPDDRAGPLGTAPSQTEVPEAPINDIKDASVASSIGVGEISETVSNQSVPITDDDSTVNKPEQLGIPIMAPMAIEFYNSEDFKEKKEWLKSHLKIDVESEVFKTNLEVFLSTLHSLSFYHSNILLDEDKDKAMNNVRSCFKEYPLYNFWALTDFEKIEFIILEARNFILQKCLNENNSKTDKGQKSLDDPLIELYKLFYRKLLARNSTLPRLNIFTTNYDLYSERAMDLLGIHYVNGFTGGISKFFNPAIFNYALAEKMDLSQSKWSVIDNFFYLYKIHGSVNWIEEEGDTKLFKVKEIQDPTFELLKDKENIMIHPTPLKYNASLGSPYSDLFREFQKKLMQNNNILVTLGYSFSDEHINNLIFQAFTIPSFRLIVVGKPNDNNAIGKLLKLNDPRIWIIGGEDKSSTPLHYFERFVNEVMPDLTAEDLDRKMETTLNNLKDLLK
ncbi:SIR2 family protein [Sphingobacterium faecale]|uniref:SIR2 family protein n=1 Tax=Sphingobacterium faecale TaxID=2803775 RepID=UPI001F21005D|nr:SIR2 family protein [Sphingobacterium faecale]